MAVVPRVSLRFPWKKGFHVLSRRLSMAKVERESSQTLSQTGIPVIVAHHTIKKAITVHPKSRGIRPSHKHQWLTKTILREGLPEDLPKASASSVDIENAIDAFKWSLLQQIAYQKEVKRNKTRFSDEIRMGFFQNLVRICCGISQQSPGLKHSFLDVSPKIHTHWYRNYNFYNLLYHPDVLLWSSVPNKIFETDVEYTMEKSLPGPYDTYSQNLFEHPIVHLRNFPGYHPHNENPYQHCHTLFLATENYQTKEQIHAHGIMGMFGVLASKAMSNGIHVGQHLPTPLTTHCVMSSGKEVVLMCYQLNTLSLQDDHGIKNCAWATDVMDFYGSCPDADEEEMSRRRGKLYGYIDASKSLPPANKDCMKQLFSFICR